MLCSRPLLNLYDSTRLRSNVTQFNCGCLVHPTQFMILRITYPSYSNGSFPEPPIASQPPQFNPKLQKVMRLVKEVAEKNTLVMGDGASDVRMIQEADIGVGISGAEGMQGIWWSIANESPRARLALLHLGSFCTYSY